MALFQPNPNPTASELRWFAGLWFPAISGMIALFLRRHHAPNVAMAVAGLTLLLAIAGVLTPPAIRPIYRFLIRVTFPIGWFVSHVIVAAAYFLVVTPVGRLMRISHDPMRRTFERSAKSYWVDCEPVDRGRYFRQM